MTISLTVNEKNGMESIPKLLQIGLTSNDIEWTMAEWGPVWSRSSSSPRYISSFLESLLHKNMPFKKSITFMHFY